MLRITIHTEQSLVRMDLEGRVAGAWVEELDHAWKGLQHSENAAIVVNLCQVTYVDSDGKRLLSDMYRAGAKFEASGCMTRSIVEELTGSCPDPHVACQEGKRDDA